MRLSICLSARRCQSPALHLNIPIPDLDMKVLYAGENDGEENDGEEVTMERTRERRMDGEEDSGEENDGNKKWRGTR